VEHKIRYFQARVNALSNHGIVHFLVQEDEGRSIEQSSFDLMGASFLSLRFDSPLHELANRAELKEIDEETFARFRGDRIPSGEIPGMTFWWLK
jgi:hypothetical protein